MSGKSGSSLGTLLFSVPLAAIPLMAIFGIPQFAPLVASPERADGYDRADDRNSERRGRSERRRGADFADESHDLDAPAFEPNRRSSAGRSLDDRYGRAPEDASDRRERSQEAWPESGDGDPAADESPAYNADAGRRQRPAMAGLGESSPSAGDASTAEDSGLTWRSAAQRLQDMGVTNYHLEQGSDALTFLFVCSFCPAASPNVEMRFESEAAEPLDAVGDVLAQIDQWQQRQSSAQP